MSAVEIRQEPKPLKCEKCGAESVLPPSEADRQGWECEPFFSGAVVCPDCSLGSYKESFLEQTEGRR